MKFLLGDTIDKIFFIESLKILFFVSFLIFSLDFLLNFVKEMEDLNEDYSFSDALKWFFVPIVCNSVEACLLSLLIPSNLCISFCFSLSFWTPSNSFKLSLFEYIQVISYLFSNKCIFSLYLPLILKKGGL